MSELQRTQICVTSEYKGRAAVCHVTGGLPCQVTERDAKGPVIGSQANNSSSNKQLLPPFLYPSLEGMHSLTSTLIPLIHTAPWVSADRLG